LTHAYIYFETQEQMDAACTQFFQFEGKSLVWVPKDTQTCHFCSDPDHVIKECDQKSQNVISKLQADLYKHTRPANYRNNKKLDPYYNAPNKLKTSKQTPIIPNKQPTTPTNVVNNNNGTNKGGSLHGNDLDQIKAQMSEFQQSLMKISQEICSFKEQYEQDKSRHIQSNLQQKTISGENAAKRKRTDTSSSSNQQSPQMPHQNKNQNSSSDLNNQPNFTHYDNKFEALMNAINTMSEKFNQFSSKIA